MWIFLPPRKDPRLDRDQSWKKVERNKSGRKTSVEKVNRIRPIFTQIFNRVCFCFPPSPERTRKVRLLSLEKIKEEKKKEERRKKQEVRKCEDVDTGVKKHEADILG